VTGDRKAEEEECFLDMLLVQHGVNKQTISKQQKPWYIKLLTFDFRLAVLVRSH
jgi:hypothetical protein